MIWSSMTNQKKFLLKNASEVFVVGLLYLVALIGLFGLFSFDDKESLTHLTAHLRHGHISTNPTGGNDRFEFTVREYPQTFYSNAIQPIDQSYFNVTEKPGTELRFSVKRQALESSSPVEYFSLVTDGNVYLKGQNYGGIMRANRMVAAFFVLAALFFAIRTQLRLKKRFVTENKPEQSKDGENIIAIDHNLVWIAENPFLLLQGTFLSIFIVIALVGPTGSWLWALIVCGLSYGYLHYLFKTKSAQWEWIQAAQAHKNQIAAGRAQAYVTTAAPKHLKAINLLLKSGVDINIHNKEGKTALHISIAQNSPEAVDLLIRNGAKVNLADTKGQTPLMSAAAIGHVGIVTKLLAAGADVLYVAPDKKTALICAEADAKKNQAVIDMLKKAVADIEAAKKKEEEKEKEKKQT